MKTESIFAFLGGVVVGGVVALLLAPQSGKETRGDIRDFVEDQYDRAKDYVDKEGQKARKIVKKGVKKVSGEIDNLRTKASAAMEEMD